MSVDLYSQAVAESPAAMMIACANQTPVAALYVNPQNPFQATCLPPQLLEKRGAQVLGPLLAATGKFLDQHQPPIATMIVTAASKSLRQALRGAGFRLAGELDYYLCHPHRFPRTAASKLQFRHANDEDYFAEIVEETCVDTLDLPQLLNVWSVRNMLRHIESLSISGTRHKLIAEQGGEAVGAVLLEVEATECRLAYLGLLPRFRGRRLGDQLMLEVLRLAGHAKVDRVVLSVDNNNTPAVKLYERHGFLRYGGQSLFFRAKGAGG